MMKDSKWFEDMAKLAGNAAGGMMDMTRELEGLITAKVEKVLQRFHVVSREEFDTAMAMLTEARHEQERLKQRISALEASANNN